MQLLLSVFSWTTHSLNIIVVFLVECLPTKSYWTTHDKIVVIGSEKSSPRPASTIGSSKPKPKTFLDHCSNVSSTMLILSIAAYIAYGNDTFSPVLRILRPMEDYVVELGLLPKKGILIEAFVSIICWTFPYLFVRRMMNPETFSQSLQKYSMDAIFGGFAAAGTVILKSVIMASIARSHWLCFYLYRNRPFCKASFYFSIISSCRRYPSIERLVYLKAFVDRWHFLLMVTWENSFKW